MNRKNRGKIKILNPNQRNKVAEITPEMKKMLILESNREPKPPENDWDLNMAFDYAIQDSPFGISNIETILATVPGHNDEDEWYWIVKLNRYVQGKKFALITAWCDYTGWDCQSGGECRLAMSEWRAVELVTPHGDQRKIKINLLEQLKNEIPFGLEI